MVKLNGTKYKESVYNICHTGKSEWICRGCHRSLQNGKMPPQAQTNNLSLCPKFEELENLCPLELMLVSKIIPFMFIVARTKVLSMDLRDNAF